MQLSCCSHREDSECIKNIPKIDVIRVGTKLGANKTTNRAKVLIGLGAIVLIELGANKTTNRAKHNYLVSNVLSENLLLVISKLQTMLYVL